MEEQRCLCLSLAVLGLLKYLILFQYNSCVVLILICVALPHNQLCNFIDSFSDLV